MPGGVAGGRSVRIAPYADDIERQLRCGGWLIFRVIVAILENIWKIMCGNRHVQTKAQYALVP